MDEAAKNRHELSEIKRKYVSGEITRDEARVLAQPILNRVNNKAAEIAKKHGKKIDKIIDFTSAIRNSY